MLLSGRGPSWRERWLIHTLRRASHIWRRLTPGADEVLKHHGGNNNQGGECGRVKPTGPKERRFRYYLVARDLAEHCVSDSGIELRAEFRWRTGFTKQAAALREFFSQPTTRVTGREMC